ncbi:unnamed protein product, partial [marine sediment metagenome]
MVKPTGPISWVTRNGACAANVDVESTSMLLSSGNIFYVGGNGTGNYSKIQDAIDNASDEDIVFVYDDSSPYIENVVIDKPIKLIGENKNTTVIDGGGWGHVVSISADFVNINGFTIQNSGYNGHDSGVKIHSNYS